MTSGGDAETAEHKEKLILNVGTQVDVPTVPVSQPKFEAWENERLLVIKTISKQ